MKYIGNNHVGFDPLSIGFPSLLGCQAVVFQVEDGLFGMHDMKQGKGYFVDPHERHGEQPEHNEISEGKAKSLKKLIEDQDKGDGVALYGIINSGHQYSNNDAGRDEWRDMLLGVAGILEFDGPVKGARITRHVANDDSIYVQASLAGGSTRVEYKRWSKLHRYGEDPDESPELKKMVRTVDPAVGDPTNFELEELGGDLHDGARTVKRIDPKKGMNLHHISRFMWTTFR